MATVTELVTDFSFLGSLSPLTSFNDGLSTAITGIGALSSALAASSAALFWWSDGQLRAADSLGTLASRTGMAAAEIQELRYIAEQTASSAGALDSSLLSLTRTIADASLSGNDTLARLGINVRDSNGQLKQADTLLREVGARMSALNLTIGQQESFASALGIDPTLIGMMRLTGSEYDSLRQRARDWGTLTQEQTEQATEYVNTMSDLRFGMSALKQLIAVGMAPEMSRLTDQFADLLASNREWIIDGAGAVIELLSELVSAITRLLPVIGLMIAAFGLWKISAMGLGAVLGVVFSPVVLITAGILALLLIIDDLIVAMQGGQSVIADFFQEFFGIDIVPILQGLVEWAGKAFDVFTDFLGVLWKVFRFFTGAGGRAIEAAVRFVTGRSGGAPEEVGAETIFPGGSGGADVPVVSEDNRQVNQNVEVNVYTSDAQAAADNILDGLQRQIESANAQFAPGGY